MAITELADAFQIEWIAKGVRQEDGLGFRGQGFFQQLTPDIVAGKGHIDKDRDCPVLNNRGDRGRETGGGGDYLIAWQYAGVIQLRSCQGHKGEQVGG